jgi:hypothetical protein
METIIFRLLARDPDILDQFANAKYFWDKFFTEHRNKSEADLAKVLTITQARFHTEIAPSDYQFAKQIMPLTAIGSLYKEGDDFQNDDHALARKVIKAFEQSYASVETKGSYLESARAVYGL